MHAEHAVHRCVLKSTCVCICDGGSVGDNLICNRGVNFSFIVLLFRVCVMMCVFDVE